MTAKVRASMDSTQSRLFLYFAALCLLCALSYAAGLYGGFLFDDYHDIVPNAALRSIETAQPHWLQLALSSNSGPLRRPFSMLSFGLNVLAFGMSPMAFKVVNIGIHLANGGLIYGLSRRLAEHLVSTGAQPIASRSIAFLTTGIWILHPLNVSGVLYVVQRMNELATMFTLAGLLCYVDCRTRLQRNEPALASGLIGLCMFGVLAIFSKENGALIFAYALVIETICFRFNTPRPGQQRVVLGLFVLTVALPIALFAAYLIIHPEWLTYSFADRNFTLAQRLLSESRIICAYLIWIFVPNPAWMGIFHDDIATSTGLFSPMSTLFASLSLVSLIVAAWRLHASHPAFAFAVAWFLVGHSMESTILPLELVFEHRNYLPMAGLLLGTICALAPKVPARWPAQATVAGCVILFCALAVTTSLRAASWGNPLRMALDDARHHPNSSRTQYEAGRALIVDGAMRGDRDAAELKAVPYFTRAAALDKADTYASINLMLIKAGNGSVEPTSIVDLANRLRNAPSYVQANPFLDMLSNANHRALSLTPQDFSTLVDAALANPHFPAPIRAMILNNFGEYRFNVVHDSQGAIDLTTAAAATDPANPYFQINLTKLALAMGQKKVAQRHLDIARQLNRVGIYDDQIKELQRLANP